MRYGPFMAFSWRMYDWITVGFYDGQRGKR